VYDEVEALLHGPPPHTALHTTDGARAHFVELSTVNYKGATPKTVRATPQHTFPTCAGAGHTKKAKDFKVGDCIMTVNGKSTVASVHLKPGAPQEEAYTIVLKAKTDLVAVDGIFSHSRPADMVMPGSKLLRGALTGASSSRTAGSTAGSAGNGRSVGFASKSGPAERFYRDVVLAAEAKLKAS